jgi:hypothetical protein
MEPKGVQYFLLVGSASYIRTHIRNPLTRYQCRSPKWLQSLRLGRFSFLLFSALTHSPSSYSSHRIASGDGRGVDSARQMIVERADASPLDGSDDTICPRSHVAGDPSIPTGSTTTGSWRYPKFSLNDIDLNHTPFIFLDLDSYFRSGSWLFLSFILTKSNSNSLANQLDIHLILAKQEKISLQQFGKRNLVKIETWQNSPPHAHIGERRSWLPSVFPSRWEGEKEIKNREGFLV